jgi:hypothetical protein
MFFETCPATDDAIICCRQVWNGLRMDDAPGTNLAAGTNLVWQRPSLPLLILDWPMRVAEEPLAARRLESIHQQNNVMGLLTFVNTGLNTGFLSHWITFSQFESKMRWSQLETIMVKIVDRLIHQEILPLSFPTTDVWSITPGIEE